MPRHRVGIDTNILSYLLDYSSPFHAAATVALAEDDPPDLVCSTLALAEILVRAYADDVARVGPVRAAIDGAPRLELLPVTVDVADRAAEIRASSRLKLPDAVHLATAVLGNCDWFLTNDRGFRNIDVGVRVVLLPEPA